MKRILALALSLMLLCCGFAEVAEEAAEPSEFEIRGLKWGMSREEVASVIGEPDDEAELPDSGVSVMGYEQVPVSKFVADMMICGLVNGQLHAVLYELWDVKEQSGIDYLTRALSGKYGEPIPADEDRLIQAMNLLGEAGEIEAEIQGSWSLEDGTYIAAFGLEGNFFLYYVNEDDFLEIRNSCNTDGL